MSVLGKKSFFKYYQAKLLFDYISRSARLCSQRDVCFKKALSNMPDGFKLGFCVLPLSNGLIVAVKKTDNHLEKIKDNDIKVNELDCIICFKNYKTAKKFLVGNQTIKQAFAEHCIVAQGDFYNVVPILDCFDLSQKYFVSKKTAKKIYENTSLGEMSRLQFFLRFVYTKVK